MAQSKRTPASYIAESRNTTSGNPFMGKTLAQMKEMYKEMTPEQRGKNVGTFRRAAAAAAKSKAKVNQQQTRTPTKPAKPKSTAAKPTASDKAVKGGYTISPEKRKPGTRGAAVQPKTKTKTKPKKNVRGSGVKKTGKKIDLGKTLKNLSDKFKLTRKAGEVFTVGNMRYVSDGKGGIRSSQRIR